MAKTGEKTGILLMPSTAASPIKQIGNTAKKRMRGPCLLRNPKRRLRNTFPPPKFQNFFDFGLGAKPSGPPLGLALPKKNYLIEAAPFGRLYHMLGTTKRCPPKSI